MIKDYRSAENAPYENSKFISDVTKNKNCIIIPGLVDVHVHLREPGFSYKETVFCGSRAAARGGFTTVAAMPNLNPVIDSLESLNIEREIIKKDAQINVIPYGSITKGEKGRKLSNMEDMAPYVLAFSDDGKGVADEKIMEEAMKKAASLNKVIAAHEEDESLLNGGYIHEGSYAKAHNHKEIPSKSEYVPIERDILIAKKTGCAYHVCHVSTKESVDLIRKAKKEGVNITAETAPHYLLLDESNLKEDASFKMNPPLRSKEDRFSLMEGINDGTIDMIASDHAPHSKEEKARGLKDSLMGIVGLETTFPLLYTSLVKEGIINIDKLLDLLWKNPMKRFNIPKNNDFAIFETDNEYTIDPEEFLSKGRCTPFKDKKVYGRCILCVCNNNIVWMEK